MNKQELVDAYKKQFESGWKDSSHIPEEYWGYKWSGYRKDFGPHEMNVLIPQSEIKSREKALHLAIDYAKNIEQNFKTGKSILFYGKKNSGKTVLATLILREAMQKLNKTALYVRFDKFLVDCTFKGGFYDKEHIDYVDEIYIEPDFLCIDEVCHKEQTSQKFKDITRYIIYSRREALKPTIITTTEQDEMLLKIFGASFVETVQDMRTFLRITIIEDTDHIARLGRISSPQAVFDRDVILKSIQKHGERNIGIIKLTRILYDCLKTN
ncbi:MAG: hypothetical protein Q7R95_10460 [bacterium]|nr:hypothetical protein [bacterium]